jgi:secreted PhoX family phosphatase
MEDSKRLLNEAVNEATLERRTVLKAGAFGAAAAAFGALAATPSAANVRTNRKSADYGELYPTRDLTTGLELLALPRGFEYKSFGWTGQIMGDGRPTPTDHDGMAVSGVRNQRISLVRNHELSAGEGPQSYVDGGMYNPAEYGGTTNLVFNTATGEFEDDWTSLGGTIRNCAGGLTPWRSWISCEETFHEWGNREDGFNHGYIFDVPAWGVSNGQPIRSAGRFSHEAVAVDPRSGIVYETEDARPSGLYAYRNPGGRARLKDGGDLYAMAIKGAPGQDMSVSYAPGDTFRIEWIKVEDPEGMHGRPLDSAPGAALFSRLEGIWYDNGFMYFVSTDGGDAGLGQIWALRLSTRDLSLVYESTDPAVMDGPDNIAVSNNGGLLLCEDGDSDPKRMIGLSKRGEVFNFCENRIVLEDGDIDIIDSYFPGTKENFWDDHVGDFQRREWAGATFYGRWLFANVQSPGVTFAITGPWGQGALA